MNRKFRKHSFLFSNLSKPIYQKAARISITNTSESSNDPSAKLKKTEKWRNDLCYWKSQTSHFSSSFPSAKIWYASQWSSPENRIDGWSWSFHAMDPVRSWVCIPSGFFIKDWIIFFIHIKRRKLKKKAYQCHCYILVVSKTTQNMQRNPDMPI